MSFGSLKTEIILNRVIEEKSALICGTFEEDLFALSISEIKRQYRTLTDNEVVNLLKLILDAMNVGKKEKIELVVTAPHSFKLSTKHTSLVVLDLIAKAESTILISGYSISNYTSELIDQVIKKSQTGVLVKFYANNLSSQDSLEKLFRYKGTFLEIYDFLHCEDKMSALHAKIISVDSRSSLISSANLSYHGLEGNIEMGCLIESVNISRNIEKVFRELLFQKVFKRI